MTVDNVDLLAHFLHAEDYLRRYDPLIRVHEPEVSIKTECCGIFERVLHDIAMMARS